MLSVIQRFASRGENADDLFQVGCVGLIKAIDNFDVSQNVRFSTYGVPMIIGEIRRYLRDNSAIRVSPLHARTRPTACCRRGKSSSVRTSVSRLSSRSPRSWTFPARRSCSPWTRWSIPSSLFDPVYSDGGDTVCVMDQVQATARNTDESLARADRPDARRWTSAWARGSGVS